ncbi:hypothetical protein H4S01_006914, partial [Coemansia sp. RSA 2610]
DEYLEILDADDELLSAIEVIDDVADTGFASIDRSPKTSASSTAVPAPDPDPNLIDECMDLCDFDDFDIVEAGVAEPVSMPAPRPSNASAAAPAHPSTRSAEKLPAPSMGLDATIDLTLDFEDELDSIGMQDLDADFGNESPKRASETWSTDSAPKRPRVAFNTSDTATTSGQLTPVSVPDSKAMSGPTLADDGERLNERLAELAKEKARISDRICDLEFADEIGNENEISLLRQRRIDIMSDIKRLQSADSTSNVQLTVSAPQAVQHAAPVFVEDHGNLETAYSAIGSGLVKPSDPEPDRAEATYPWTKDVYKALRQ